MRHLALLLAALVAVPRPAAAPRTERARWEARARDVTITRDDWGIAHIKGKTDADAIFGMMYAQGEDDFNRVETNFINAMGRLAEAEGEAEIWRDLRMKLFINPDLLKAMYAKAPANMKALMDAWADGLNFYLATHPTVKPRVITKFEPWMALSFSEGSIGGDIEKVSLGDLRAFYGNAADAPAAGRGGRGGRTAPPEDEEPQFREPAGSNGAAIAPSNTTAKRALLLINPHTSFFFRSEQQVTSDEGLNAYGASTWGQFFIYQGFNARVGWMHTTSNVDDLDEYLETVVKKGDKSFYKYGTGERPFTAETITVPYKTANGMQSRTFTVYRSHHGPIVRSVDGKWVAFRSMQEPLKALTQSYTRTKARNYAEFVKSMDLHTNSSNNTIYADADGNIGYFHGNFIPKRDPKFDWTKPVDGSDPATEWQGLLSVSESPLLKNPASGWLYNSNDNPWNAAGASSQKPSQFPAYVESGSTNARTWHALKVFDGRKDFSIPALMGAAYDSYMPFFASTVPGLLKAYDALPQGDERKGKLAPAIGALRTWDYRWSVSSVATTTAVFWGEELGRRVIAEARRANQGVDNWLMEGHAPADAMLDALVASTAKVAADFGKWDTPWGEVNRFQRLTDDIVHPFNDGGASIPVGFASARWGSLASFGARAYPNTKKWYGTSGNSFVAVVEFGADSVRARAVSAGGESGDVSSKHFNDQAQRYATGDLREVYFYPAALKAHTARTYQPGK
jgi:acyl-homoserine lactone acylase PvdQ